MRISIQREDKSPIIISTVRTAKKPYKVPKQRIRKARHAMANKLISWSNKLDGGAA